MSSNRHSSKGLHRWAPLVVVLVIPAVLCAAAVKSARASFYKVQPILCDGVDDDSGPPIPCVLPKETTNELSSTKAKPHVLAKAVYPSASRSRITPALIHRPISSAEPPARFKGPLSNRAGSSDDPDVPH